MSPTAKQERVQHANELIKIISSHGRRFFYNAGNDCVAHIEMDERGKIWFIDDYTRKRIYTHRTTLGNKWRGFSHGGTLRDLIEWMCGYISKGDKLPRCLIAPERSFGDSNIWGYEIEAAKAVREAANQLPIMDAGDAV